MTIGHSKGQLTVSHLRDNEFMLHSEVGPDPKWLMCVQHRGWQLPAQQRENMRRLVACWNACEGSSTKWLEFQTNPDKVEQFGNEPFETRYSNALRSGLKATEDRDALLKALRAMVNEPQPLGIDRPVYQQALALIDSVNLPISHAQE